MALGSNIRSRIPGLKQNILIRASAWSIAGFGSGQLLRLVSNLILTRMLIPEAFGLMALVNIVLQGLGLLTDVGIGASVVQNKRGDETAFLNTAWTIHVLRGFFLFVCTCLVAYPMSAFYGEPDLFLIILAMSLTVLIGGFNSATVFLASRKLWVGRITIMRLVVRVVGICVTVAWANFSPTVWAFVIGGIVTALLSAVSSHLIFPWRKVKFQWEGSAAKEILRFGKWMLLTSGLAFLSSQIDRLSLAKLVPLAVLGVYSIGFMWSMLPLQVIHTWMGSVFFPIAAETFRNGDENRARLRLYRRRMLGLSTLGIAVFGGLITPVYRLLYTPTYWQATEFLEIILLGVLIRILDEPYRAYNLALGQPKYTSYGSAASLLIFAAAVYPLFTAYSAYGVAMAYSASQLGTLAVSIYGLRRTGLSDLKIDILAVLLCLGVWGGLYFATRDLV